MNNNIQVFNYQDFTVRTYTDEDGETWLVAKDVCAVLGIQNHKDAISALDDDEKLGVEIPDPHGRLQMTNVISEAGLYKLTFRSNKPGAKEFTRKVTHEILPQINHTGSYSINNSKPVVVEQEKKGNLPAHSGSIKAGERLAVRVFKCKSEEDFQTVIAMNEDFCDAFGYSWLDRHGFKLRSKIIPAPQGELSRYAVSFEQSYTTKSYFWEHDYDLSKIAAKNNDDDNDTVNFDEWSY